MFQSRALKPKVISRTDPIVARALKRCGGAESVIRDFSRNKEQFHSAINCRRARVRSKLRPRNVLTAPIVILFYMYKRQRNYSDCARL